VNEHELREMLQHRAGTISAIPTEAPKAIRRARRRLLFNVTVGALAGLAIIAGAFTGVRTLRAAPTPADHPAPAPTVNEEPPTLLPTGSLEPGRYILSTLAPHFDDAYRVSIEVPPGYRNVGDFAVLQGGLVESGVSAWVVASVYEDGCEGANSLVDRWAGGSTDGLVDLLVNQAGFRSTAPTDVVVDGFAGTYMERTLSARTVPDDCVTHRFMVWRTRGNGKRWLAHAGQHDLLWILDVDGAPLVIDAAVDADASAQDRAEVIRMVDSIQIDPR